MTGFPNDFLTSSSNEDMDSVCSCALGACGEGRRGKKSYLGERTVGLLDQRTRLVRQCSCQSEAYSVIRDFEWSLELEALRMDRQDV